MNDALLEVVARMIYLLILAGIGSVQQVLCLSPIWRYSASEALGLGATLVVGWSISLFRRNVGNVPGWLAAAAIAQILVITGAFFWSYLTDPWFGAVIVGTVVVLILPHVGRDAQAAINTVRFGGWMQAWRMIERSQWPDVAPR